MSSKPLRMALLLILVVGSVAILAYLLLGNRNSAMVSLKTINKLYLENELHEKFTVKNFRGKHVFINFWQSWCGPCRAEMPMIDSAFQLIDKNKWVFLVLNDEDWDTINGFKSSYPFQMPFYKSNSSFVANGIRTYPISLVLDTSGNIVNQEVGQLPYNPKSFVNYLNNL
jgi:thiol-disulfide isomerase/thioredoxin